MKTPSVVSCSACEIVTAANLVSFIRIVLVPFAISTGSSVRGLACFIIVLGICTSDVLDGIVARATGTAGPVGAAIDVVADGVAVFGLQVALVVRGDWPVHVLATSATAYAIFLLCARRDREVVRKPIGRYLGAAVMALLLVHGGLTVFAPGARAGIVDAAGWALSLYGAVALVESLRSRRGTTPCKLRPGRRRGGRPGDLTWAAAIGLAEVHKP